MTSRNQSEGHPINRRDMLKLALSTGAALVAAGAPQIRSAEAGTVYYGTDSGTQTCCGMPQHFYIGKIGEGRYQYTSYFNTTAASWAGRYNTHAYWWVYGPNHAQKNTSSNYDWGYRQAEYAGNAWYTHPYASYFYGKTIFADIEEGPYSGYSGWSSNRGKNRDVLRGWLNGIAGYRYNGRLVGLEPGFYTRPNLWNQYFGSGHRTHRAAVLWVSGCSTCTISCPPCSSCTTTPPDVVNRMERVKKTRLGGNKVVVWQYWIDNCWMNCGDFNAARKSPYGSFTPIRSSSTYKKSC